MRKDGRWLENGDECGILKIRYGDAPLLNIALTWSKIPLLPWISDAVAYLKKNQSDLTQTARKPRAVFAYYCLFGCSICIYFKDLYADNRG